MLALAAQTARTLRAGEYLTNEGNELRTAQEQQGFIAVTPT